MTYRAAMPPVHVLGNVTDSERNQRVQQVVAVLERRGVAAVVIRADSAEEALAAAREAVANGCERLIAVGGDGVVHVAVNAVAGTGTVLGIVPDGTGNDFARALGFDDTDGGSGDDGLDADVQRALGEATPVDALRTNHGWVASVATLGFSGDVTERANGLRWPTGSLRYTAATLLQLPRLRTIDIALSVDDVRVGNATTLLAVGNTAWFGGGMKICPEAQHDDGLLHAVNIGHVPRHRFLRLLPTVFSGRHVDRREVETRSGSVATIDGSSEVELWADGERLGPLPVRLEVVAGALHIAGA